MGEYFKNILERKVLRQEIKEIITNAILNGEMNPGDRIVETKVARDLNVSQAPVREAIRELEQMGLVETKPYKGAFVRNIGKDEFYEAYKLRSFIEGYAAEKIAHRIDDDVVVKMEEKLQEMQKFAQEKNFSEFIETDVAFHELLIKSMGSNLFHTVWAMVRMAQLPYFALTKAEMSLDDLILEHTMIKDALKKRDAKDACRCVQNHIEKIGEKLLSNSLLN